MLATWTMTPERGRSGGAPSRTARCCRAARAPAAALALLSTLAVAAATAAATTDMPSIAHTAASLQTAVRGWCAAGRLQCSTDANKYVCCNGRCVTKSREGDGDDDCGDDSDEDGRWSTCHAGGSPAAADLAAAAAADTAAVGSMHGLFCSNSGCGDGNAGCGGFNGDIGRWDVAGAKDMSRMFEDARAFNHNLGAWDVAGVVDMSGMFHRAEAFNQNLAEWSVEGVTDMSRMFQSARAFDQNLAAWDVAGVADMGRMFDGTDALGGAYNKAAIRSGASWAASAAFQSAGYNRSWPVALARIRLHTAVRVWCAAGQGRDPAASGVAAHALARAADTAAVGSMNGLFCSSAGCGNGNAGCGGFNADIGRWDVAGVVDMRRMFHRAEAFNHNLGAWDVAGVVDMSGMFAVAKAFNQNLAAWDVAGVVDMRWMFHDAKAFNHNLGAWSVAGVTDMRGMFLYSKAFNQNLAAWSVAGVTDVSQMFYYAKAFNQNLGAWDVTKVVDMSGMFLHARAFNQNLGAWDVAGVVDMSRMFHRAEAFNGNLAAWSVAGVADMGSMFDSAEAFNRNLAAWDVAGVKRMSWMFFGTPALSAHNKAAIRGGASWAANPAFVPPNARQTAWRKAAALCQAHPVSGQVGILFGNASQITVASHTWQNKGPAYKLERLAQFVAQLNAARSTPTNASHWAYKMCRTPAASQHPPYAFVNLEDGPDVAYSRHKPEVYDMFTRKGCPHGHLLEWTSLRLRPQKNPQCIHTLPNPYAADAHKPSAERLRDAFNQTAALPRKHPAVVYRGSNLAFWVPRLAKSSAVYVNQRLQISDLSDRFGWLDASLRRSGKQAGPWHALTVAEMARSRYVLDVGGYGGTSWDGLLWKLASGSVVMRMPTANKDWWHSLVEPWVHYIPLEHSVANISVLAHDIAKKFEWAEAHPTDAQRMADRAQQLARHVTQTGTSVQCTKAILDAVSPGAGQGNAVTHSDWRLMQEM